MQPKFAIIFIFLLILNCNSSKVSETKKSKPLKTVTTDKYSFSHPNDWYTFYWHDKLNVTSESIKDRGLNVYNNKISILENSLALFNTNTNKDINSLEDYVNHYIENFREQSNYTDIDFKKESKIMPNGTIYILNTYQKWKGKASRSVIYFLKKDDAIYHINYTSSTFIHKKYLEKAMSILNSFNIK
ncbi:hypothetical protein [Pontimicrobium sp. MEBiC01747]